LKDIYLYITIIYCFFLNIGYGQTYKITTIETSKFPIVEANILAYDIAYSPDSLPQNKISIIENGQTITPIEFKAPTATLLPTSIVLALDISASMEGIRFEILKKTAKQFLDYLPMEISEVAIASFSNDITLNCDFTHDINRLKKSIDRLNTMGGTNFNKAFLTPFSGAVSIARQGYYKRIIIFITDGLSDVNAQDVTKRAIFDTTLVNCLTIGLPISDELKSISQETGGNFYSNLLYEDQIIKAFEEIYTDIQINTYGKIKWKSQYSCEPEKQTEIILNNESFQIKYKIPPNKLGTIEATPLNIEFPKGLINETQFQAVLIQGKNIGLNITNIQSSNDSFFGYNGNLPIQTEANGQKLLQLAFTPKDTLYSINEYTIYNPGCPEVVIEAATLGIKKIKITNPVEGQVFYRGTQVPIAWKGVGKSTSVNFFYQTKGSSTWTNIGCGNQYNLNWVAPVLNSEIRIQGQITNDITLQNILSSNKSIIDGSEFKSAYFSPDGEQILTLSNNGILKNWNTETKLLNHTFENPVTGDFVFFPDLNRVVAFNSDEIEFYTNRNGLSITKMPFNEQKNTTSFTHIHDKEIYLTITNYAHLGQYFGNKFIDKTGAAKSKYFIARKASKINIIDKVSGKNWFSIKLEDNYKKSILHKTKNILAISYFDYILLYNLEDKSIINNFKNETFVSFPVNDDYIFTANQDSIFLNEIKTGKRVSKLKKNSIYTLSNNGIYLANVYKDSLYIQNIVKKHLVWNKYYPNIHQIRFFPNSTKLLIHFSDSLHIFDLLTNKTLHSVYTEHNLVKLIDIAPNEKSLLITTPHAVVNWEIKKRFDADTTDYFSIICPQPKVQENINFSKQYVNQSIEKVFNNLIQNPNNFPLFIDSIWVESSDSSFSLVSTKGSFRIDALNKASIELKFSPKTIGNIKGILIIKSGFNSYSCNITGKGIKREFEFPTPQLNFQALFINELTDTLIPIISNTGTEPLHVHSCQIFPSNISSYYFTNSIKPTVLKAGDTLYATINFLPNIRGRQNAQILLLLDNNQQLKATEIMGSGIAKRKLIIAGNTIESLTKRPIPSHVTLIELNSGKIINTKNTNAQGKYNFLVKTDLNYSLTAELDGYFSSSVNIDLTKPQTNDTLWTQIDLTPLLSDAQVKLNNIFFEFAKADLLNISKSELLRIVAVLNKNSELKIEVHGHTDNIGNASNNLILSKARAYAVKKYLIEKGISESRITLKHFGELYPVAENITNEGRKANRRVEIKFIQ